MFYVTVLILSGGNKLNLSLCVAVCGCMWLAAVLQSDLSPAMIIRLTVEMKRCASSLSEGIIMKIITYANNTRHQKFCANSFSLAMQQD